MFYDHLWQEAAEDYNSHQPINLLLDLMIKSPENIMGQLEDHIYSTDYLKQLINNSVSLQFLWEDRGGLLSIIGDREKSLNLYFEIEDPESIAFQGKTIEIRGLISPRFYSMKC